MRAPLVVGADGRRSLVARGVGAERPHRATPTAGRATSPTAGRPARVGRHRRPVARGPRAGHRVPVRRRACARAADAAARTRRAFSADPRASTSARWRAPGARGAPARLPSRGQGPAPNSPSYFRRSAGPGWALAGDAGHFKDPVTAQGIRDALRFGRRLGEAAAPVLDDPRALDAALGDWELERDRGCLETYQWTNLLARGGGDEPAGGRALPPRQRRPGARQDVLDVFSRTVRPAKLLTARRFARLTARALARGEAGRREILRVARRELRVSARHGLQRLWLHVGGSMTRASEGRARPTLSPAAAAAKARPAASRPGAGPA